MAISSHVCYVEPNYVYNHRKKYTSFDENGNESSVDGLIPYEEIPSTEDYCIAFQLAVEVPQPKLNGKVTSANSVYILGFNSNKDNTAVSLLQGTRMNLKTEEWKGVPYLYNDDSKNIVHYLTTAPLNTVLQDIQEAPSTEMFGVKSVDIAYDNWMTPQVTIQFTDIRGASLFVPEEMRHPYYNAGLAVENDEQGRNIPGSFFKCFFVTPYPMFGLVVKGFYGEAVGYELMYTSFKYKLNASTGNFEAEAKFVGYTWSVLGDITMNAIAAAPYSTYKGKDYWAMRVKEGAFTSKEGFELPTLAKMISAYRAIKNNKKTINPNDAVAIEAKMIAEDTTNYETIQSTVNNAISEMAGKFKILKNTDFIPLTDDNGISCGFIFLCGSYTKISTVNSVNYNGKTPNEYNFENYNIKEEEATQIKNSFLNLKSAFNLGLECDIKMFDTHTIDFNSIDDEKFTQRSNIVKLSKPIFKISSKEGNAIKTYTLTDEAKKCYDEKKLNNIINDFIANKVNNKTDSIVSYLDTTPANDTVYGIIINTDEWNKQMSKVITDNKEKQANNEDELQKKFQLEVAEAIGMAPTLYNVTKSIMAHLETLIHCIYECENEIPEDRSFETTDLDSTAFYNECSSKPGANNVNNEGSYTSQIIPPFPQVRVRKERDGRKVVEDAWIGDITDDSTSFREIELVEGLLHGIDGLVADEFSSLNHEVFNEDGSISRFPFVAPVAPSDITQVTKIINPSLLDNSNNADLIGAVALRGAYVTYAIHDIHKHANEAGQIDAANFFDACNLKLSETWKMLIDTMSSGDFADLVYNVVTCESLDADSAKYIANGKLPWQNKVKSALLDKDYIRPILPQDKTGYWYQISNISFANSCFENNVCDGAEYFIKMGNTSKPPLPDANNYFAINCNPFYYKNVIDTFDDETSKKLLKDVSVGAIKDNFKKLQVTGALKKDGDYHKLFANGFSRGFRKTFVAGTGKDVKFRPNQTGPNQDIEKRTYTLPSSRDEAKMLSNKTAFVFLGSNKIYKYDESRSIVVATADNSIETITYNFNNTDFSEFLGNDGLSSTVDYNLKDYTFYQFAGVTGSGNGTAEECVFTQVDYVEANSLETKGVLFLGSFFNVQCTNIKDSKFDYGIDGSKCTELLLKINDKFMVKILPYFYILMLGAYFYYLDSNGKHNLSNLAISALRNSFPEKYDGDFRIWRLVVRQKIKEEFFNWLNGNEIDSNYKPSVNYMSFKEIQDAFEVFKSKTLFNDLYNILTTNKEKVGGLNTLEQFLANNTTDNFFKNYVSLSAPIGSHSYAKLYNRDDSVDARKIASMFIQPVLFVQFQDWYWGKEIVGGSGGTQEWGKGDDSSELFRYNNAVKKFKEYLAGFHSHLQKLIGDTSLKNLETNTTSGDLFISSEEIDSHIKTTLYKYLKLIYDRWLSAGLFQGQGQDRHTHWNVDKFFEEHFHFIDQFYVNCEDIFFDMEDLASKFESSFTQESMSLLEYLINSLAKCKCAMYPVQNFLNYYSPNGQRTMENLFKAIPYNEAFANTLQPHQIYPDFVVLYTSEPSLKSDDECGDSFMLNGDECFLPYAIRYNTGDTKNKCYRIPCFGVTYGKQYQSYFKNIEIGTDTPIPTEQSLKAQYMIASKASPTGNETGQQIGCLGQDLYTIYSNQSYTCTVQMMGNMWIQPTMYFVLTNVPSFRGSYIIQKVSHQIAPGTMTTTFMGTRMANSSQPHVYNWFIGKAPMGNGNGLRMPDVGTIASPDNDCDYKFFMPGGSGSSGIGGLSVNGLMWVLTNEGWSGSNGNKAYGEQCVVGPIGDGSRIGYGPGLTDSVASIVNHSITSGQVISGDQVWDDFVTVSNHTQSELEKKGITVEKYGQNGYDLMYYLNHWLPVGMKITADNANNAEEIADVLRSSSIIIWPDKNRTWYGQALAEAKNDASVAQQIIDDFVGICLGVPPANPGHRYKAYIGEASPDVKEFVYGKVGKPKETSEDKDKTSEEKLNDIVESIRKTCAYSSAINISTIKTQESQEKDVIYISAGPDFISPSENNAILFDVALNTYCDYLEGIGWVVSDANSGGNFPSYIRLMLSDNNSTTFASYTVIHKEGDNWKAISDSKTGSLNDHFYRSVAKKYLKNKLTVDDWCKKGVRNFTSLSNEEITSILEKFKPSPCNIGGASQMDGSLKMPDSGYYYRAGGDNTSSKLPPGVSVSEAGTVVAK